MVKPAKSSVKKGKKYNTFKVNDYVFAKVKGFRWWPAKIINDKDSMGKFAVYFYGTSENAFLRPENLLDYLENHEKAKFINKKFLEMPVFASAKLQIDKAIQNGDGAQVICVEDIPKSKQAEAKSSESTFYISS